jgi:hypothetical protein
MSADDVGSDPTVTLLIRLWRSVEEPILRARLVEIRAGSKTTVATAAGESGIRAAVARWLSRCAAESDSEGSEAKMGE